MTTGRRLLVVAYTFPPMPTIGASRWDAMARHLRLAGHDVTVISTSAFGQRHDPAEERHIRRAADLTAAPWLRRGLGRGPLPPASDAAAPQQPALQSESPLPDFLRQIFVPDLYVATWLPQALYLARRVIRERDIECVITTSPYESVQLIGLMLRGQRPAWIADFRDGWSFEPHRSVFPTGPQRWLDSWLERRIAVRADALVAATEPIAADFRQRLGVQAFHIANGFDPLQHPSAVAFEPPMPAAGSIALVHTGKLLGHSKRDPGGLFAAFRRLRREDPTAAARLQLVLAGRLDSQEARVVEESGITENIVLPGELSHSDAVALQRRADVLLLLTSADGLEATGKVFEYLSAGRPILALASSTVEGIVAATGTGTTVPPDDVDAIYEQLRRIASGDLPPYEPRGLEPYVYPGPAELMSEVIESAITSRVA